MNEIGMSDDTVEANDGSFNPDCSSEELPISFIQPRMAFGQIPLMRVSIPCVVIGKNWAAWVPILPALGAKVSVVVGSSRQEFLDSDQGELVFLENGSEATKCFLMSVPKDMLIFISGCTMFVKGLAPILGSHIRLVIALDSGNRASGPLPHVFPLLRWSRLVHAEFGGVTSSQNWFGAGVGITLGSLVKNPYR
jgi:hypothetical protein